MAMSLCIEAWQALHSCRSSNLQVIPRGDGGVLTFTYPGSIPHDAITDWCRWHSVDYELGELVIAVIQKLDVDRTDRINSEMNLRS